MNWFKREANPQNIRKNETYLSFPFFLTANWWKRASLKTAGYDYADVLSNQISEMISYLQPMVGKVVGADKSVKALQTRNNVWQKAVVTNDKNLLFNARAEAFKELRKAWELVHSQGNSQQAVQNPTMRGVQQTLNNATGWASIGSPGTDLNARITLVPGSTFNNGKPGPENWIKISNFSLHPEGYYDKKKGFSKNPTGEVVEQAMGDWAVVGTPPRDPNVYIRGTQEAWNKFLGISSWVFANDDNIKSFKFPQPLPSEKDFDPNFQSNEGEQFVKGQTPRKPLMVQEAPPTGKSGKATGGLKIFFDAKNEFFRQDFPVIRDYVLKIDQQKQASRFSPTSVVVDWANGLLYIPDISPKDNDIALAIYSLANKLQDLGYDKTTDIRAVVQKLTGIANKEAYSDESDAKRSEERSPIETKNAIAMNVIKTGPKISTRFHGIAQQLGIDLTQPLSPENHDKVLRAAYAGKPAPQNPGAPAIPYGPENWVGPFGSTTTPHQQVAQAEGMRFTTSRTTSVLADEPGSGKTAQAIVGADSVREEGQKVLVVTPNILLEENWVGNDAKGPMFFCGHDRSQVMVVNSAEELQKATNDPNIVWVVIRDTTLQLTGGPAKQLITGISKAAKEKKFSSLIIDEIQRYKNSDSNRFQQMQLAISGYDIPHRIGLTGTPADNTPDDIFSQMALLRHRVLYENKGKNNWVTAQNVVGFAKQFLGGEELSTGIQLSDDEKKLPPEKQEEIMQTKWAHKASGVLQWVQKLDAAKKQNILDLFSTTYLRRNKEDIKPEMPPINRDNKIEVPSDPNIPHRRDAKTLERIALAKAPSTANAVVAKLQANPTQKVFVASRFISSANEIARLINEKMGDGTSVAITSKLTDPILKQMGDEKARSMAAEQFRKPNGIIPGKQSPLRAAVYTLDLGAVGLNFSNATEGVINDMAWNPSTNLQAEYRVHRIDSKLPVNITYTMMKGTYDEEMHRRVNKKLAINNAMSNLMREAQKEKDPKKRAKLADVFVKDAIDNILIDAGLTPKQQRWFEENLSRAFQGQPVQTFQQMIQQERMKQTEALLHNLPPSLIAGTSHTVPNAVREKAVEELEDRFGEEWTGLPEEVLKPFLHMVFTQPSAQVAA
jgi:hypothetical protein